MIDSPSTAFARGLAVAGLLLRVVPGSAGEPEVAWARQLGGAGAEVAYAAALHPDGVVVAGTFEGEAEFGTGEPSLIATADRRRDGFVALYAADGRPLWVQALGGRRGDAPRSLAVDAEGRIYVVGYFNERLELPGGRRLESRGGADGFRVMLDRQGRLLEARSGGGEEIDTALAIALVGDGSTLVTGGFSSRVDVGGRSFESAGGQDAFLARVGEDGEIVWWLRAGAGGADSGLAVSVDPSGEIYWLGRFQDTVELGDLPALESHQAALFLARLGPAGTPRWLRSLGAADAPGSGLVASANGVVVAGSFRDRLEPSLDNGTVLAAVGGLDGFLLSVRADGRLRWAGRFGGPGTDFVSALSAADGRLFVGGYYQGWADFDPGLGVVRRSVAGAAATDAWVAGFGADGALVGLGTLGGGGAEQALAVAAGSGAVYVVVLFHDALELAGERWSPRGKTDLLLVRLDGM